MLGLTFLFPIRRRIDKKKYLGRTKRHTTGKSLHLSVNISYIRVDGIRVRLCSVQTGQHRFRFPRVDTITQQPAHPPIYPIHPVPNQPTHRPTDQPTDRPNSPIYSIHPRTQPAHPPTHRPTYRPIQLTQPNPPPPTSPTPPPVLPHPNPTQR